MHDINWTFSDERLKANDQVSKVASEMHYHTSYLNCCKVGRRSIHLKLWFQDKIKPNAAILVVMLRAMELTCRLEA